MSKREDEEDEDESLRTEEEASTALEEDSDQYKEDEDQYEDEDEEPSGAGEVNNQHQPVVAGKSKLCSSKSERKMEAASGQSTSRSSSSGSYRSFHSELCRSTFF